MKVCWFQTRVEELIFLKTDPWTGPCYFSSRSALNSYEISETIANLANRAYTSRTRRERKLNYVLRIRNEWRFHEQSRPWRRIFDVKACRYIIATLQTYYQSAIDALQTRAAELRDDQDSCQEINQRSASIPRRTVQMITRPRGHRARSHRHH